MEADENMTVSVAVRYALRRTEVSHTKFVVVISTEMDVQSGFFLLRDECIS